jgi:3-oxoadipate enol-lactonase
MTFVALHGCVHHYDLAGRDDRPALMFANSLGSDLRIWDELAERLSGQFKIIRYDHRGHGLSDAPPPPYSTDDLAGDVAALLDHLETRQAVLCGVSVGGLIAQAAAVKYPERVRALVLSDTGARIGSVESWQQRIEIIQTDGVASIEKMTMERWFSFGFRERRPADVRGYANMLRQTSTDGYVGTCSALRDGDLRDAVKNIRCPTLVLCGAEDIATPPELSRDLTGLIPGAKFSLIEEAAHLPCVEQPAAMAERMLEFFREVRIV